MPRLPHLLALGVLAITQCICHARLGETAIQCADRYGPPKKDTFTKIEEKNSPLLKGAIEHTYLYQGWKIRAAFLTLDGPAVSMEYHKISSAGVNSQLQDNEIEAILKGEAPEGTSWRQIFFNDPHSHAEGLEQRAIEAYLSHVLGAKMWQRTDGAVAWIQIGFNSVHLELPAAKQHEDGLKAQQEQKARTSVPAF